MRDNFYMLQLEVDETSSTGNGAASNSNENGTQKELDDARYNINRQVSQGLGYAGDAFGSIMSANTGIQQDAFGAGVNAVGKIAGSTGTWWGTMIQGATALGQGLSKAGQRELRLDMNTGNSAYGDYSRTVGGKANNQALINPIAGFMNLAGVLNNSSKYGSGGAQEAERQKKLFANAKVVTDKQTKKRNAAVNGVDDTAINNYQQTHGENAAYSILAKNGGILDFVEDTSDFINAFCAVLDAELQEPEGEVSMFENGGSVIPTGALHKNKHHLEDENEELKGEITEKGIPVISKEENGNIIQHAEIEKEEIILELSLSQKIEKLWKEGTDEAAIKAGKLLAEEIMTDTKDEAGLIDKVTD